MFLKRKSSSIKKSNLLIIIGILTILTINVAYASFTRASTGLVYTTSPTIWGETYLEYSSTYPEILGIAPIEKIASLPSKQPYVPFGGRIVVSDLDSDSIPDISYQRHYYSPQRHTIIGMEHTLNNNYVKSYALFIGVGGDYIHDAGDVDSDFKMEISGSYRITSTQDSFFIYESASSSSYPSQKIWETGPLNCYQYPTYSLFADLDQDGRNELLIGCTVNFYVYESIGDNNLALVYTYPIEAGYGLTEFSFGDFDEDGKLEIALPLADRKGDPTGGKVVILENRGDNTFVETWSTTLPYPGRSTLKVLGSKVALDNNNNYLIVSAVDARTDKTINSIFTFKNIGDDNFVLVDSLSYDAPPLVLFDFDVGKIDILKDRIVINTPFSDGFNHIFIYSISEEKLLKVDDITIAFYDSPTIRIGDTNTNYMSEIIFDTPADVSIWEFNTTIIYPIPIPPERPRLPY